MNPCFSSFPERPSLQPEVSSANPLALSIRPARPQDATDLAGLLADSFHGGQGLEHWVYPLIRLGIYEDLRYRLRAPAPHYACFVALDRATMDRDAKRFAGTVEIALRSVASWPWGGSQHPYISNLAVAAEKRRRGVARQLLQACERKAWEWGFPDIYLHVLENNDRARRLYAKAGYQVRQSECSWRSWLLGQPRRLLLHKSIRTSDR